MTENAQVTTFIANDDEVTSHAPLTRPIEVLIDPSIEPEGLLSHFARELEVLVAILERRPKFQL
jgi:hypothetical protein